MGAVYKARDTELDRIVAIKTIAEGRFATSDQRERFRAEARAVARLRHPNIIAIHAIGEHDDQPYLASEFAEGGSLAQRLVEKPMAPREAAALLEILARAVHAAHQAGVVHRDLKPSNILLTAEGVPKVSDFGLAKLMDADSGRTVTGQVLGSPSFMAPEQAEGRSKDVGPAADVYALGSILYQALTGRPPFLGESQLETLKLVVSNDVVPPCRLRPDVPRDLETICLKCLEKEPARRYSDAMALADDLRRYLEGRPILARAPARWNGPGAGVAATRAWPRPASPPRRWRPSSPSARPRRPSSSAASATGSPPTWSGSRAPRPRPSRSATGRSPPRARPTGRGPRCGPSWSSCRTRSWRRPDPRTRRGAWAARSRCALALDTAESGIEKAFKDQPAVEAAIRAALGETYYYLGDPDRPSARSERAVRTAAAGPRPRPRRHACDRPTTSRISTSTAAGSMRPWRCSSESLNRRLADLGPDHPDT